MTSTKRVVLLVLLSVASVNAFSQSIETIDVVAYSDSARVAISTDVPTTAVIDYGLLATDEFQVVVSDTLFEHSVLLPGLTPEMSYVMDITVTDTLALSTDSLGISFSTPPLPDISGIATVGLASSAEFVFETNVPTYATIQYGVTPALGSQRVGNTLTTEHDMTVSGLSSNTLYYYQIVVFDSLTQLATHDSTVTTTSVPVISNVMITDTTKNSVTITFDTDVRAYAYVQVRDTTDNPNQFRLFSATDSVLQTTHTIVVDTLEDITSKPWNLSRYLPVSDGKYQYRIVAVDSVGNKRTGSTSEFVTKSYGDALPAGWESKTIGPTYLQGRASYDDETGTFSVLGQGSNLFNDADDFHFIYKDVVGDFIIEARMNWKAGSFVSFSKAGTHFRVDTTYNSAMVNHSYNYRGPDYFYYRDVAGVSHSEIETTELQDYEGEIIWGRLVRSGNDFTTQYSKDGVDWTYHGPSEGVNIPLPREGMMGLIVVSKTTRLLEVYYDSVTVMPLEDVTPPIVAGVSATPVNNTGQVTYAANEWVTTTIDYGLTASYTDSLVVDTAHVANVVTLDGLLFNTEYHYRIRAFDADSNVYVSPDMTFITEDNNPLAVDLAQFTATTNGRDVRLAWEMESTDGLARFDVQLKRGDAFDTVDAVQKADVSGTVYDSRISDLDYGLYSFRLRIVNDDGSVDYSQEIEVAVTLGEAFVLETAYPNPFTTRATFGLTVREAQPIRIELFNAAGQLVSVLHDGMMEGNSEQQVEIDGANLAGGLYLYRVRGASFVETGKLVLLK